MHKCQNVRSTINQQAVCMVWAMTPSQQNALLTVIGMQQKDETMVVVTAVAGETPASHH